MKQWILDVLKGVVIGIANIIPGVSGGTMMVVMGIYDKIIFCVNNIFKQFGKCIRILAPYALGIVLALVFMSAIILGSMENFPLPTAFAFIGLIMGGLPAIFAEVKGVKFNWKHWLAFLIAAGILVGMQFMPQSDRQTVDVDLVQMFIILLMGVISAATMIIPGVSGSMMLMILGYYYPIYGSIPLLVEALVSGNWAAAGSYACILLPFVIGIVTGIVGMSRVIDVMLKKWKALTYAIILGLVVPSPIVILMSTWQEQQLTMASVNVWSVIFSVITCAVGVAIAVWVMPMLDASVKKPAAEK